VSGLPQVPLDRYREARLEIESGILPLASSVDGRRFTLQASMHDLPFAVGGYVALDDGARRRIGQVISLEIARQQGPELGLQPSADVHVTGTLTVRAAAGEGVVLGEPSGPFHDARVRPATAEEVAEALRGQDSRLAELVIGELLHAPSVPAVLQASGFDRHTFLCGQSGSGKTYSLGVVLERLLLETELRVVVLDPNSDHVRLGAVRTGADAALAARFGAHAPAVVVRSGETLRLRFAELGATTIAAVLRLDPVADREEYAELAALLRDDTRKVDSLDELARAGGAGEALATRARNLGVDGWGVWARDSGHSVLRDLAGDDWRCLVVDTGSLPSSAEQTLVADAVLGALWGLRQRRQPLLLVVDEAHNVCPAVPTGALLEESTETAVRIAGEGRKFGLYLLVATQRPEKVHENVLSQSDNLILLRMNSEADVRHLERTFSFVPPTLLGQATGFRQGEALVAGKIAPSPTFVRFGARITEEGGSDVPADWARRPG
jgi:hypothetical protein